MNVLFSGVGGPTPLGLAKSVRLRWPDHHLIGIDASAWAPSLHQSDVFDSTYQVPLATAPSYWDEIEKIVADRQVDFAFIVPETEVIQWSKRAETHDLPCRAHVPAYRLAALCFDKQRVSDLLHPLGLAPKTIAIDAASPSQELAPPYWIRVKSGAGALGALKINEAKDLETWLQLHGRRDDFIASDYLPGRNYACKMLYRDGGLVQASVAERIDYLLAAAAPSGISGMCARGRLLNRDDLVDASTRAITAVGEAAEATLDGMFTVDFKEDAQGTALITEINIRHVSFNLAFALGGSNFAATTLSMFFDERFEAPGVVHFEEERTFVRGVDAPLRLV